MTAGQPYSPLDQRPVTQPVGTGEIRLLDVARVLLAHRGLAFGTPLVFALVGALLSFVLPKTYVAESSFISQSANPGINLAGGLASLASGHLGLSLSGDQYSPDFYAQLVTSRSILDSILLTGFPASSSDSLTTKPLLDILGVSGTPLKRLEKGERKLSEAISASVAFRTGVVTLRVEAHDPGLAARIANKVLLQLQLFDRQTRQLQARERRLFVEGRVAEAAGALTAAEAALRGFLERNRRYEESPRLRFEYDQVQRQIALAQETYVSLRRQYEEARIDEVNDTPVLTVIDRPVPPQRVAWPRWNLFVLVALIIGGIVGVSGALGRDMARRLVQGGDPDYRLLASEWAQVKGKLLGTSPDRR